MYRKWTSWCRDMMICFKLHPCKIRKALTPFNFAPFNFLQKVWYFADSEVACNDFGSSCILSVLRFICPWMILLLSSSVSVPPSFRRCGPITGEHLNNQVCSRFDLASCWAFAICPGRVDKAAVLVDLHGHSYSAKLQQQARLQASDSSWLCLPACSVAAAKPGHRGLSDLFVAQGSESPCETYVAASGPLASCERGESCT